MYTWIEFSVAFVKYPFAQEMVLGSVWWVERKFQAAEERLEPILPRLSLVEWPNKQGKS